MKSLKYLYIHPRFAAGRTAAAGRTTAAGLAVAVGLAVGLPLFLIAPSKAPKSLRAPFIGRPHFIAYNVEGKKPLSVKLSCLLGAMNVGWTSHDATNEKGRDTVIFEYYRPATKWRKFNPENNKK